MKLLDHTKTDQGYMVRIWLDEISPDRIEEYAWGPYSSSYSFTEAQYRQQQLDQANKLATQTLAQLTVAPVVITQDTNAIAEQAAAIAPENIEATE